MTNNAGQLERDPVRGQHQLLYPEGLLALNETGAAIVGLCDGRSVEEIKQELTKSFSQSDLGSDVDQFLMRLVRKGLIRDDGNA